MTEDIDASVKTSERYIRVPTTLFEDRNLGANEKLILISLLNHYNLDKNCAWPSHETIAAECGLSRSTVIRTTKKLAEKGYITIRNDLRKSGRHDIYRVNNVNSQSFLQNSSSVVPTPKNAPGDRTNVSDGNIECVGEKHSMCQSDTFNVSQGNIHCVPETHSESANVSDGNIECVGEKHSMCQSDTFNVSQGNIHCVPETHSESANVSERDFQCVTQRHSLCQSDTFNVSQRHMNYNQEQIQEQNQEQNKDPVTKTHSAEISKNSTLKKEFERLWEMYPRKEGKMSALKSYCKQRKGGASFDEIQKGLQGYIRKLKADCTESRYIKMGSTFFGPSECWRDYIDTNVSGYGGFREPTDKSEFERERRLIKHEFGGDANVYATWLLDGEPQPVGEWYARYKDRRKHDGERGD